MRWSRPCGPGPARVSSICPGWCTTPTPDPSTPRSRSPNASPRLESTPWRTVEQVEVATLEYLDWFNHRRLFQACGDIPPAELEHAYHRHHTALAEAGQTTN